MDIIEDFNDKSLSEKCSIVSLLAEKKLNDTEKLINIYFDLLTYPEKDLQTAQDFLSELELEKIELEHYRDNIITSIAFIKEQWEQGLTDGTNKSIAYSFIVSNTIKVNRFNDLLKKFDLVVEKAKIKLRSLLNNNPGHNANATEEPIPNTFEELFNDPGLIYPCINILRELTPPVIDSVNNYIGKNKGIFPIWIGVLKKHSPTPIIKHYKETIYKDLLNKKFNGLNLSKDASEFRKNYKRLDKKDKEIKALVSQISQKGRLGK